MSSTAPPFTALEQQEGVGLQRDSAQRLTQGLTTVDRVTSVVSVDL